jgi:hypothetical protein
METIIEQQNEDVSSPAYSAAAAVSATAPAPAPTPAVPANDATTLTHGDNNRRNSVQYLQNNKNSNDENNNVAYGKRDVRDNKRHIAKLAAAINNRRNNNNTANKFSVLKKAVRTDKSQNKNDDKNTIVQTDVSIPSHRMELLPKEVRDEMQQKIQQQQWRTQHQRQQQQQSKQLLQQQANKGGGDHSERTPIDFDVSFDELDFNVSDSNDDDNDNDNDSDLWNTANNSNNANEHQSDNDNNNDNDHVGMAEKNHSIENRRDQTIRKPPPSLGNCTTNDTTKDTGVGGTIPIVSGPSKLVSGQFHNTDNKLHHQRSTSRDSADTDVLDNTEVSVDDDNINTTTNNEHMNTVVVKTNDEFIDVININDDETNNINNSIHNQQEQQQQQKHHQEHRDPKLDNRNTPAFTTLTSFGSDENWYPEPVRIIESSPQVAASSTTQYQLLVPASHITTTTKAAAASSSSSRSPPLPAGTGTSSEVEYSPSTPRIGNKRKEPSILHSTGSVTKSLLGRTLDMFRSNSNIINNNDNSNRNQSNQNNITDPEISDEFPSPLLQRQLQHKNKNVMSNNDNEREPTSTCVQIIVVSSTIIVLGN